MDTFSECQSINSLLTDGKEALARDELIKMLAMLEADGLPYTPLVNHLIRNVGLFPYLDINTTTWEDRYVYEAFKVDTGDEEPLPLHREQSHLLSALMQGIDIAVSAPTSFGKSFVIDAFIALKKPEIVVILVPTIALADETRRRLQKKFGHSYKIITTPDQSITERNIFIFPQERALGYLHALKHVDILIVDEFYKASKSFDKERSPALIYSIMRLKQVSDQKYFLAPNIDELKNSELTEDMQFMRLDFNTVFLQKNDLCKEIAGDEEKKNSALLGILEANPGKTLIYAGTYTNIRKISNLLIDELSEVKHDLPHMFSSWLTKNYDSNWELTRLAPKGVGVHNGQLHRALSQIQIRMFEEEGGLNTLISTSSIIEGVNTSAENVILWSNKSGRARINDFTYKNIIGRGGRMFKHFVGKIFILEEPPAEDSTQLELEIPDEILGLVDERSSDLHFTAEQLEAIHAYENEMTNLVGADNLEYLRQPGILQSTNKDLVINIAKDIRSDASSWHGLRYLNSSDINSWDRLLYKLIRLRPEAWEIQWSKYVGFVKILSKNWHLSVPQLLEELSPLDIGINEFFKLERNTTFKLASLLGDVCSIYNRISNEKEVDLTPALSNIAHAFLPPVVYQLEEYGLPRMISRKLQNSDYIDFEDHELSIHDALIQFNQIGLEKLIRGTGTLDSFDIYILKYFFDGITTRQ